MAYWVFDAKCRAIARLKVGDADVGLMTFPQRERNRSNRRFERHLFASVIVIGGTVVKHAAALSFSYDFVFR
jgi:hypothetical protein